MMRPHLRLIAVACLLASGCGKPSDVDKPKLSPPPPIKAETPAAGGTESESNDTDVMPKDWEAEAVIEINAGGTEAKGNTLSATPIEPTPVQVEWRELGEVEAGLELIYLASGVLARAGDKLLVPGDDGKLVVRPELQLPAGEILGDWPGDAWVHESKRVDNEVEHRLWRYVDGAWAPQVHKKKDSWTGPDLELRKGWQGSFLIRDGSRVTRVGTTRDGGKVGPRMGTQVAAIVETRSGRIYNVSDRSNGLYVQRDCSDFACVEENAIKLPYGKQWSFPMQVPRQRHSVSLLAIVQIEGGAEGYHLLHYEIGGWKLESLVHRPRGLWPAEDGGLWIVVNDALWFRKSGGSWHAIELPKGASGISAALDVERGELWLAATIAGKRKLLATAAQLE